MNKVGIVPVHVREQADINGNFFTLWDVENLEVLRRIVSMWGMYTDDFSGDELDVSGQFRYDVDKSPYFELVLHPKES